MKIRGNQQGFTIVEFLISIGVFSVVLLICSYAIVHVGRMYYKGIITNRTQDAGRRAVDDIASAIQFGIHATPASFYRQNVTQLGTTGFQSICLGNTRYTFIVSKSQGTTTAQTDHVLWKDRLTVAGTGCPVANLDNANPSGGDGTEGRDLLGQNMRVPEFGITPPGAGESLWQIRLRVSYGDVDSMFTDGATASGCISARVGGQFCAVTRFDTSVVKRL